MAMIAVSRKNKGMTPDGKNIVDAFVLADSAPGTLPTDGTDVIGLSSNDVFAPFSMLFALPSTVYIANSEGVFTAT